MRISAWSSDVCSSDLKARHARARSRRPPAGDAGQFPLTARGFFVQDRVRRGLPPLLARGAAATGESRSPPTPEDRVGRRLRCARPSDDRQLLSRPYISGMDERASIGPGRLEAPFALRPGTTPVAVVQGAA